MSVWPIVVTIDSLVEKKTSWLGISLPSNPRTYICIFLFIFPRPIGDCCGFLLPPKPILPLSPCSYFFFVLFCFGMETIVFQVNIQGAKIVKVWKTRVCVCFPFSRIAQSRPADRHFALTEMRTILFPIQNRVSHLERVPIGIGGRLTLAFHIPWKTKIVRVGDCQKLFGLKEKKKRPQWWRTGFIRSGFSFFLSSTH